LANFFEKITYGIRVHALPAQKEQRRHWQADPARTNETVHDIIGVQFETGIFRHDRGLREENSFCMSFRYPSIVISRSPKLSIAGRGYRRRPYQNG